MRAGCCDLTLLALGVSFALTSSAMAQPAVTVAPADVTVVVGQSKQFTTSATVGTATVGFLFARRSAQMD